MNVYKIKVKNENKTIDVSFRLTLKAQVELKNKYNESAMSTIFSAVDDAEKLADLLTQALNYKGNENTITDGEELYDILVDNGYVGTEKFMGLVVDIGTTSGLLTKEQGEKIVKMSSGLIDEALEEMEESEAKN